MPQEGDRVTDETAGERGKRRDEVAAAVYAGLFAQHGLAPDIQAREWARLSLKFAEIFLEEADRRPY